MAPEPTAADAAPAPSRKAQRWEEHKELTRRKLLASARGLFAERGFHATSAADIAAGAGVTERTLFRYFPSKIALVLDEAITLLPVMFQVIRDRPAGESPYRAVCEGIIEFGIRHRPLALLLAGGPPAIELPVEGQQRTLIDFEEDLAAVLRERYAVPPDDQITPSVWARASIGALRTALLAMVRNPAPAAPPGATPVADLVRACFAALEGRS